MDAESDGAAAVEEVRPTKVVTEHVDLVMRCQVGGTQERQKAPSC